MASGGEVASGLGGFLRARRERISPQDLGLPVHGRRRTRGLRREEVAVLAGASIDYYTRLEQGRDEHPSWSIVSALADALRLSPDERAHLHLLAGLPAPTTYVSPPDPVRSSINTLLETLMPAPAYVVTPIGDLVAWNEATSVLWIDPATLAPAERNLARLTLLEPRMRQLWVEWEQLAREAVAHLRAATAMFPSDTRLTTLVRELLVLSPEFAQWWMEHDVALQRSRRKRFRHPEEGELAFFNESMEMVGEGLLFMVYLPADIRTREVCQRLAAPSSLGAPEKTSVARARRLLQAVPASTPPDLDRRSVTT